MNYYSYAAFKKVIDELRRKIIGCRINNITVIISHDFLCTLSMIKDESDELLYAYSRLFYRFSDDPYKGIKIIEIANTLIERNNPLGHYLLASSLYTGVGGKKSFKEGNKHYEIAANMGHAPSMYNLAIAYSRGLEIRKSYRKLKNKY